VSFLDATQLASLRLIFVGLGLILLLIYRPQGYFREYRLKMSSLIKPGGVRASGPSSKKMQ
jgi:branched-chain amino acid transport system permease protein